MHLPMDTVLQHTLTKMTRLDFHQNNPSCEEEYTLYIHAMTVIYVSIGPRFAGSEQIGSDTSASDHTVIL